MTVDPVGALLGAAVCGAAGAGVPALIARMRDPRYASVAALPGLAWRAAVVAALSGAVLGGAVGLDWPLLFLLPLVPVGVALAFIDLRTHLLPTRLIWPTLAVTAVLAAVAALADGEPRAFLHAVVGGVAVFAFFHVLWWIYPSGMGYGDVRLSAVVGLVLGYVGWGALVVGVYGGFLVFAVIGVLRAGARRDRSVLRTPLPFGPFLLGGVLAGVALGPSTWSHLVGG
ncbi:A24 family peptidase [Nocardioides conyzicola]|uniref:Prepilin type IV endopeptidase peptidase domain-containing protein n=1 Tax=Nocardioides conyzicola TaxID=1651781 RepID=A0ABP8XUT1_9ACTN